MSIKLAKSPRHPPKLEIVFKGRGLMSQVKFGRMAYLVTLFVIGLALLSPFTAAQSVKVEGIVQARNGDTMILRSSSSPNVTVLLSDSTKVGQIQGVFKARR